MIKMNLVVNTAAAVKESRTLVSHKDVSIAFLVGGVDGAVETLTGCSNPAKSLEKAIASLNEQGADTAQLADYAAEHFPVGTRGRTAPGVGETRTYKAQQLKDNDPFLRVPVAALGLKKGESAHLSFESGRIVIECAQA